MCKPLTIKDIYDYTKDKNLPLLGVFDIETLKFMEVYNNYQSQDLYTTIKYGKYIPLMLSSQNKITDSVYQVWVKIVQTIISLHKYELTGMYKTTLLDYNPIENYSMTEEETNNIGGKTDINTSNYGEQKNNTAYTNNPREDTENTTEKTAPYDTQEFVNKNRNETTRNYGVSTGNTEGTINPYTDIHTMDFGAQENKRNFKRSGNIGVTTSQQMLLSEREVVKLNFFDYLLQIIITDLCYR